jgi:hypothetical protein
MISGKVVQKVWGIIFIITAHMRLKIYCYDKATSINLYFCFAARGVVFLRAVILPAVL